MRIVEILFETIKTKSFKHLYHVGTLDAGLKRSGSHEGSGLSVSTHPDAWREIAPGYVTGDTYIANKPGNKFLDAHSLSKGDKLKIANWGISQELLVPAETVRVSWYDDEMEDTMYMDFSSMEEAENEMGSLDDYEIRTQLTGYTATSKLKKLSNNQQIAPTGIIDFLLPLYAEEAGFDGVWWEDKLDPLRYSAPRGVICVAKVNTWTFTKADET